MSGSGCYAFCAAVCLPLIEEPPLYLICFTYCAIDCGDPPSDPIDAQAKAHVPTNTMLPPPAKPPK